MKRLNEESEDEVLGDTFVINKRTMSVLNKRRTISFLSSYDEESIFRRTFLGVSAGGGDGLKDVPWDGFFCLMEYLDLEGVVSLGRVCKRLNQMIGTWIGKIHSLVTNWNRNKLVLSIWLDTINKWDKNHTSVISHKGKQYTIQLLLDEKLKTTDHTWRKTLFKMTLPSKEVMFVCQSSNAPLAHYDLCINYQNNQEHLFYWESIDEEGSQETSGWNQPPTPFLQRYCDIFSFDTPQDMLLFFNVCGKIEIVGGAIDDNDCYPSINKVDFELFFEFGRNEAAYTQFLIDLEQIVSHKHIKNQLLRVLPQALRKYHYSSCSFNWKKRMSILNYCEFPEIKDLKLLLEYMSLSDIKYCEIEIIPCIGLLLEVQFSIYLKYLDQNSTLHIRFNRTNYDLVIETSLYLTQSATPMDLVSCLNDQFEIDWTTELWYWVLMAILSCTLDTIRTPPLKMNKNHWEIALLNGPSRKTMKKFKLKKKF